MMMNKLMCILSFNVTYLACSLVVLLLQSSMMRLNLQHKLECLMCVGETLHMAFIHE